MKRIIFAVLSIMTINSAVLFGSADQKEAIKLVSTDLTVSYGSQRIPSITETANVFLRGTKVQGDVYVNGNLNANDANISDITVNGNAIFTNCTIKGNISVYGNVQIVNSHVQGTITTYAQKLILTSSQTSTITVKDNSGQQVVSLRKKSNVKGNITFKSKKGVVEQAQGSLITGTVVGGKRQKSL